MDKEFFKEHYDREWNQSSYLTSAIGIPIGGCSIIGGIVVTLSQSFAYVESNVAPLFLLAIGIAAIALGVSIFCIFKSLIGYKYDWLASPLLMLSYVEDLEKWCDENGETPEYAKNQFDSDLVIRYAEAAHKNRANNVIRSKYIQIATVSLSLALLFLMVSAIPYVIAQSDLPASIQRVKLVE